MTDIDDIREELEHTSQMLAVIKRFGNIDLFGLYNFTDMISYVRKKGVLEAYELLRVNDLLRACEYLNEYCKNISEPYKKICLIEYLPMIF